VRRWIWFSVRLGISAGITSGVIIGVVAGIGGSVFTSTLSDLATFAISAFWLLLLALPLIYGRNVAVIAGTDSAKGQLGAQITTITLIAWLPAYLSAVVAFMIPVVMVPVVLNKGVTFDNAAHWYDQVYTPILNGPVLWVGAATIIGFAAVAYVTRRSVQ